MEIHTVVLEVLTTAYAQDDGRVQVDQIIKHCLKIKSSVSMDCLAKGLMKVEPDMCAVRLKQLELLLADNKYKSAQDAFEVVKVRLTGLEIAKEAEEKKNLEAQLAAKDVQQRTNDTMTGIKLQQVKLGV